MINKNAGNWLAWPVCPQCQERREAHCKICSTRGTDFRLADFDEPEDVLEAADATDVLLLCSTCDEPCTPHFSRCCIGCGFDFGEGIEQPEVEREELNNRVVVVVVGVVLLLGGLLAFFAIVLRN